MSKKQQKGDILRIDLDMQSLQIILASIKNATIKGEDAPAFTKVIDKIETSIEKEIAKNG